MCWFLIRQLKGSTNARTEASFVGTIVESRPLHRYLVRLENDREIEAFLCRRWGKALPTLEPHPFFQPIAVLAAGSTAMLAKMSLRTIKDNLDSQNIEDTMRPFTRRIAETVLHYPSERVLLHSEDRYGKLTLFCFHVPGVWSPPYCYVAETNRTSFLVSMLDTASVSRALSLSQLEVSTSREYMALLQKALTNRIIVKDCEQFVRHGGDPAAFRQPAMSEDGLSLFAFERGSDSLELVRVTIDHHLDIQRYGEAASSDQCHV